MSDSTFLISQRTAFKKYYLATIGANIAALSIGSVLGYSSPALNSLSQPTSKITLDTYQQGWFSSLVALAALIGALASGKAIETYGRKGTLMFASIPMLIGWLVIVYVQNLPSLFIGRFITGFSVGLSNVAGPVYIAETSSPKTRGILGLSFPLTMSLGVLFSYVVGYYKNWYYLALYCSVIPAIQMVVMFFLPETPDWLVKNHRVDEVYECIDFLYGSDHNLLTLAFFNENEDCDLFQNKKFDLFTQRRYRTPFLYCLIVMFFQQFAGINAIIFYTSDILKSAKSSIDANLATIYIGLVQFLTCIVSCLLVDRFGRKFLLYLSGFLMGIAMLVFSLYYFLANNDQIKTNYGWVPLVTLVVFIFSFSIGYASVPWLLMSELIPNKVKGLASGLVTTFNFFCMFLITWKFKTLTELVDAKYVYLAFSLISFLSLFFTYFYLPESKGKSLAEIENFFTQENVTSAQPENTNSEQNEP